jgi:GNAT superfamily N-acetyltransferase
VLFRRRGRPVVSPRYDARVISPLAVRRASPADADLVTEIISLSFARDPLWAHAMARPGDGTAHHSEFWRLFVEGALRYPWTWLAGGGEAASIWIPPGGTELTAEQERDLQELAADRLGPAAGDYLELVSRFDAAHPRAEPHYYLTLLGTHPEHRGKGVGMRLLAHDLALIDAEHMPAYLESSNPANDHRYASVGFEPHGEFCYPGGGPVVTTMWRPAR